MLLMEEPRVTERTDAQLLVRVAADGDEAAFEQLFRRHRERVFAFHLRLVGERGLAEDLLQETFLRVYRFADSFDPLRAVEPWLFRIARNAALNALRARAKAKPAVGDADRATSDRIAAAVAEGEATQDVQEALAALDDEQRALLVQRFGLEMPLAQLAESLGCTERTVRNRLHAAVRALTQVLLERRAATQGDDA